jgi:hypothetical protein
MGLGWAGQPPLEPPGFKGAADIGVEGTRPVEVLAALRRQNKYAIKHTNARPTAPTLAPTAMAVTFLWLLDALLDGLIVAGKANADVVFGMADDEDEVGEVWAVVVGVRVGSIGAAVVVVHGDADIAAAGQKPSSSSVVSNPVVRL